MPIIHATRQPMSGVTFFRLYQPLLSLQEPPYNYDIRIFADDYFDKALAQYGDIYFSCSPSYQGQLDLIKLLKKFDRKVICDYDDSETVLPTNHIYCLNGEEECKVTLADGSEFYWQDKITQILMFGKEHTFDIKRNKENNEIMKQIKREATCLTTTTETMKKELLKYNDRVYVLPNIIDPVLYTPKKNSNDKQVRVGWVLSSSHLDDFVSLKPELIKCLNASPDMKLVIMCFGLYAEAEKLQQEMGEDRVEICPGVNMDRGYHKIFSELQLDIGICHLEDNDYSKKKSPLKYAEYSAMGIPSIASKVLYGDYTSDKENVYLYDNMKEFRGLVKYLINRPIYRERVGKEAKEMAYKNWGKESVIPKYDSMIKEIIAL